MPVTRRVNGKLYILDESGRYQEAGPLDQAGADTSGMGAFGVGVASYPGQFMEMLKPLAVGAMPVTAREQPLTPPSPAVQAAENVGQFHPYAVMAGQIAPDLAALPLGMGAGTAAKVAGGRMAQRVAAQIQRSAALPKPGPQEAVGLLRRGVQMADSALSAVTGPIGQAARTAGRSMAQRQSVGAAGAQSVAGEMAPGMRTGPLETLWRELLDPVPMNTQQLESAIWGRQRGYEQLPGMSDGLQLLRAGAESDPIIRPALIPVLRGNQARFEANMRQAFGLANEGREGFGKATLGEIRDRVTGPVYQRVERALDDGGGVPLPEDFLTAVEDYLPRKQLKLLGMDLEGGLSGERLMNLRSLLWETAEGLTLNNQPVAGKAARALVRQLEDIMEAKIGDQELMQAWRLAGNRYRLLMALEKPGVVGKDGSISVPKLANVLKREYPDEFARMREGARARLNPEIRNILNDVEFFDTFGSLIGDSGTATRMSLRDVDPRSLASRFWLRQAMEGYVEGLNPARTP